MHDKNIMLSFCFSYVLYFRFGFLLVSSLLLCFSLAAPGYASGLDEVKKNGVLRHLGVPYAHFVTVSGDGLDVELMRRFAEYLGVACKYVPTTWSEAIPALIGKQIKTSGSEVEVLGERPIQGDCLANGLTVLPWREELLAYSQPTFITQVWLVAAADSVLNPITPSGDLGHDIQSTKKLPAGQSLMGRAGTCLDPGLYGLEKAGADIKMFPGNLNELAPAVIQDEAELTLLDVPDALVALQKWPGQIKVLGPISEIQYMGVAFRKQDQGLRQAFNRFFRQCREDGTYDQLVNKYYPEVMDYFPDFFSTEK